MTVAHQFALIALLAVVGAVHGQESEGGRSDATYVFLATVSSPDSGAEGLEEGRLVTVDEIYLQKGTFEDQTGRQVRVLGAQALSNGAQYVFYGEPVRFADVVTVALFEAVAGAGSATARQGESLKQELERESVRREIEQRVEQARVIVQGRVDRVRPFAQTSARDSEHLPDLRLARVEVQQVIKGEVSTATIEFLFAASRDVQWFRAPKFEVGDSGVFLLQSAGNEVAAFGAGQERLTLLSPLDYRRDNDLAQVTAAVQGQDR